MLGVSVGFIRAPPDGHASEKRAPVMLASGPEASANTPAQQVSEHRAANWQPEERASIPSKEGIRQIADQVHAEYRDGQPVTPPLAAPESGSSACAGGGNEEQQQHGPATQPFETHSRRWIEPPQQL